MTIDPVGKKVGDGELKLPLDNPTVAEALRKGNIHDVHKILTDYGITAADFEQFAANQHSKYMNSLVQPEPLYEGSGAMPQPDIDDFSEHEVSNVLNDEDIRSASLGIGKAMSVGKAQGAAPDMTDTKKHLDEWTQFYNDVLEPKIVEAQFAQQLQTKSAELEREFQKILAMVKSGQIEDPAILILALAKVNVEKNGLIFTQLGKRVMNYNEQANKVTNQLMASTSFEKDSIQASQKLKTTNQNITFLTNDMNQVMQSIQSWLTAPKSAIDTIRSGQAEIVRKVSAT